MAVHKYLLKEELVLDSVTGGHQNVEETLLSAIHELFSDLGIPLLELVVDNIDALLVDVDARVEVCCILGDLLLEMHRELGAIVIVDVGTERPND